MQKCQIAHKILYRMQMAIKCTKSELQNECLREYVHIVGCGTRSSISK